MKHPRQRTILVRFPARWLAGLVAFAFGLGLACAADFRVTIEPNIIRAGEGAELALEFENGQPEQEVNLPTVPGLAFSDRGQATSISIINGRQSATIARKYLVVASQPGTYTIPALSVRMQGQTFTSAPVQFQVLAPGQAAATPSMDNRALARIQPQRTNLFVGDVLPVELAIYAVNPTSYELSPLLAEGFTVGRTERLAATRVPMNGVLYTRAGVQTIVTPSKAGTLQLGPVKGRVVVSVPIARRRSRDPFDDFFSDPFFSRNTEEVAVEVEAPAVAIRVQPLPAAGQPAGFTGAVGDYVMTVTAGPTNVAAGEPVKLRIELNGRGALDSLKLPSFDNWAGFRVYPPVGRVETTDTLGVQGAKIFELDAVPQSAEVTAIPPIAFSFFNPVSKTYLTATNAAIPLLVRPTAQGRLLAANEPASEPAAPVRDLAHLKPHLGTLAIMAPPLVARPWFLALQMVPLLVWLGALVWRKRQEHLASNPHLVQRQRVARRVRAGLAELSTLAARGDSPAFFAAVFRLVQAQLGERLGVPDASITESVVDEHLRPRGVREDLLVEVQSVFNACNHARYAPAASASDLQAFAGRVDRLVRELQRVKLA